MKHTPVSLSPRAALFIGAALLSTPAFAQEQTVAPPPVVSTVPAPAPAPAPAPQRTIVIAPSAPVVQAVPEAAPAEAAPARTTARRAAATTTTRRTATQTTTRAPAAAAAPAPAPEPAAAAPVETLPAEPVAVEPAPAPVVEDTTTTAATTPEPAQGAPIWPWVLLGGLVLAGLLVALMLRRRREDVAYAEPIATPVTERAKVAPFAEEPKYAPVASEPQPEIRPEPVLAGAPVFAAAQPVDIAEPIETEAVAHDAGKSDLAGVLGTAPAAHRPWIEFGMRPVRAGTTDEEATVEIELTVGNSGDMAAKDVHITTFMMTDVAEGAEMEDLLLQHAQDEDTVAPVSIEPGEGTRIDATLATPKGELGRVFNPIVVADARYTLPDGSEGRTAAAFRIGRPGVEGLGAIGATRPHMVDNVDAELERVLERA